MGVDSGHPLGYIEVTPKGNFSKPLTNGQTDQLLQASV